MKPITLLFLLPFLSTANDIALVQFRLNLIDNDRNGVIATLELSELRAMHDDVVSLSFSETGQQLFGFGPIYRGEFDGMTCLGVEFIQLGNNTLAGVDPEMALSATMVDNDPPHSSLPELIGES